MIRLTLSALAGGGAVTAIQRQSKSDWFGQTHFEDKRDFRKCQPQSARKSHTEHQDEVVPRNSIEEFDPGSA